MKEILKNVLLLTISYNSNLYARYLWSLFWKFLLCYKIVAVTIKKYSTDKSQHSPKILPFSLSILRKFKFMERWLDSTACIRDRKYSEVNEKCIFTWELIIRCDERAILAGRPKKSGLSSSGRLSIIWR